MFTDVNLVGKIDGVELAHLATQCCPNIHLIVTSGRALTKSLPEGAIFMPKPWLPLERATRGRAFTALSAVARG